MYPQQPGQQPPYPPQQGPADLPPQPGQQQAYPTQPADPWQLQQPQATPAIQATPQPYPQPVIPQQPLQPNGTYNSPEVPLTPDGIAPIDYLEQIAPKQKASFSFSRKHIAIAGGVILVAFLGIAITTLMQGSKPNITALSQYLTTKVTATNAIVKKSQKNLQSRQLDALNGNIAIQLTNINAGLANAFAEAGVVVVIPENAADDTSVDTAAKLEDARLLGHFDRVYVREMSFRLQTILSTINSIYNTTSNANLRKYLETTYKNLEPLQKELEEYSASTS